MELYHKVVYNLDNENPYTFLCVDQEVSQLQSDLMSNSWLM